MGSGGTGPKWQKLYIFYKNWTLIILKQDIVLYDVSYHRNFLCRLLVSSCAGVVQNHKHDQYS